MRTIKLVVQYDGSDYVGWQRQGKGVSVQGLIEDALATIDGAPVTLHGAGRTDAGVHAVGQVASARVTSPIEDWQLVRALNAHLPEAIRVTELTTVPDSFHARFSATAKTYEYRIWNGRTVPPFIRQYAWHIIEPLNLALMQEASQRDPGRARFRRVPERPEHEPHDRPRDHRASAWRQDGRADARLRDRRQGISPLHGAQPGRARWSRSAGASAPWAISPGCWRRRTAPRPAGPPRRAGLFLMKVEY